MVRPLANLRRSIMVPLAINLICNGGSTSLSPYGYLFVNLCLLDVHFYYLFLRIGETQAKSSMSLLRVMFGSDFQNIKIVINVIL